MDALSALKMVAVPGLGNSLAAERASALPAISMADLQQLSPGLSLPAAGATAPAGSSPASFQNLLGGFIQEVSDQQTAAGNAVTGLLSGKNVSLHQAMISMEEASVSFQMMVEVRNRLLDSYQELMRMQV